MPLTVACDGSALGNPGPAGWAWYISDTQWAAGGWPNSTNNRGELQAVIEILRATDRTDLDLHILADSKYVINSVTKWMPVWKRNNWKKKGGGEVLNRDQMELIGELVDRLEQAGRTLRFEWVKGHNDHPLNDAADARARAAAEAYQRGAEVPAGPGFEGTSGAGDTGSPAPAAATTPDRAAAQTRAAHDSDAGGESAGGTTQVWCELNTELADRIVALARAAGVSPHDKLAELIEKGLNA